MGLKYLDLAVLVTCERVTEGDLGVLVAIKYAQDVRCLVARTKASGGTNCCRCLLPDVYFLSCCKMYWARYVDPWRGQKMKLYCKTTA